MTHPPAPFRMHQMRSVSSSGRPSVAPGLRWTWVLAESRAAVSRDAQTLDGLGCGGA